MPVSWVTRHQGFGGTTAFRSQGKAVRQYALYLDAHRQRADLFRVSHDGDIEAFDVRQRIEHAIVVQHVLSSEG